jgi:hypothetical protein
LKIIIQVLLFGKQYIQKLRNLFFIKIIIYILIKKYIINI